MSWNVASFREKIEKEHNFPGEYIFKFIVPLGKKAEVLAFLPKGEIVFRNSSKNAYVSITLKVQVENSNEIISVYEKAYGVDGIVAL